MPETNVVAPMGLEHMRLLLNFLTEEILRVRDCRRHSMSNPARSKGKQYT